MAEIQGTYEERFEPLRAVLAKQIETGLDVGASVAVYLEGELVADLWGGHVDEERTRPWERDSIVNVWSTTKTMTALCALVLADRGEIDFDAPVTRYWPEFGAAGKDSVAVRHLMSHTAGLAGWTVPIEVPDLFEWEKVCSLLADQEPWWEPGTASGYHALTQGYLVGEVVRRVTGRSVGTFFAEEIARPLGADFHIGTPPECDSRVVPVIPPPGIEAQLAQAGLSEMALRTLANPPITADASWTVEWRRAEIPAANGHGNARSVGAVQSVLSNRGEARGVRLLSPAGCETVFREQSNGTDLVLGMPLRFGIGYGLAGDLIPIGPHACFWGGWGGSIVINDLDSRLTVTYVMNRMESGLVGDTRGAGIALATATALAA
jgi:CubicO group peptidase (beta-lactamase class C family)